MDFWCEKFTTGLVASYLFQTHQRDVIRKKKNVNLIFFFILFPFLFVQSRKQKEIKWSFLCILIRKLTPFHHSYFTLELRYVKLQQVS